MLAGTMTTARLDRVLTAATTLGLGDGVLTAAATELQLARNRTDEVSNDVGHLVYLLTRMLFSAVATSSLLRTVTTATLKRLLSLGAVFTLTSRGGGREVRWRVGWCGLRRKKSKRIPPLLVGRLGSNVGRGGGGHTI